MEEQKQVKLWAKTIQRHKIQQEAVREFSSARPSDAAGWLPLITELCKPLDVAVPVILPKHVHELARFSRTVFKPHDFMESVAFDSFEIEIFPEKKKDTRVSYSFENSDR